MSVSGLGVARVPKVVYLSASKFSQQRDVWPDASTVANSVRTILHPIMYLNVIVSDVELASTGELTGLEQRKPRESASLSDQKNY